MELKQLVNIAKKVEMGVRLTGLAAMTYVVLKELREDK